MRKFRERNLLIVAAVAAVVLLAAGLFAINIGSLTSTTYSADFQSAVGLQAGDVVTIAGVRVGSVGGLSLDGNVAKVTFSVGSGHHLGSDTEVNVKVLNPVGVEYLELVPMGPGSLRGTIPVTHTTIPGTLVGDLNQLTKQTQQTNIPQLVKALEVLTNTFSANTPEQTKAALDGVARLSAVLGGRQLEVEDLVSQANQLTGVLNGNSGQLVDLLDQSDLLLAVLQQRKAAIDSLLKTTSGLVGQIDHIISGDRAVLDPVLQQLDTLSATLAKDSNDVGAAIPLLATFSRYSANVTGSGPFADFVAPALVIPDNLVAQCSAPGAIDSQRGCRA